MSSIPTKQIDGDVAVGRNVSAGGNANIQGNARVGHDLVVEGWLEAKNIKGVNKGLFATVAALREAYPQPHDGWFAGVSASDKDIADLGLTVQQGKALFRMYIGSGGDWVCEPLNKLYEIVVDDEFRSELYSMYENLIGKELVDGACVQQLDNEVNLKFSMYDAVVGKKVRDAEVLIEPATNERAGVMGAHHVQKLLELSKRIYLSVDHSDRLVVHGAEQYMAKGLEPVVFRCLRRSNRRTKMSAGNSWVRNGRGPTERRWTVFSHSSDAVKVDAGGVLSFCTTLFDGAEETPDNPLEYSNAAATLLLHPHLRSIFYGREFFGLDDVEALRMLKFPFVLAFIPHTRFGPATPRITLDDAEAAVPFFVRYTPCFEYDTPGRYMTASHRFRFSLK